MLPARQPAAPRTPPTPPERPDADVLEELRDRRTLGTRAWKKRREEGQKDIQCVAGEVWQALDPDGLRQRNATNRPAISCDELGQYINQVGNDVRQNKRAVKATPIGSGATDKTATFRQNLIRQIEYRSNAQREVYSPMFEDALQRGYSFGRIKAQHVSDTSRDQELIIEAFPNPDVVTVDPDGAMLAPDCSKIEWGFILDSNWTKKKFKREFRETAQIVDFTDDHAKLAPDWIQGENLTLAEYWTIERMRRRVVFLKADPAVGVYVDMLAVEPPAEAIDYERWVDVPYVCQYFTNGVELLAKNGQKKRTIWGLGDGPVPTAKSIPIFSCFGKVLYVQTGTGTEARTLSMVRLAREPVMGLAYTRTCQVEILGSVPRTTWVGYEGQFRGHEEEWAKANHEPTPYQVVKPKTEATGNEILPLPVRQSWDPPLQNTEMMAEAFRRSIQAAMGTSPLPTQAQRQNEKSGKALKQIEASGQKGSYHFVDHLDGMITRVGMLLDENIPWVYDAKREVTIRDPKDQPSTQAINDPANPEAIDATTGHHDYTVTVGPAYADEREASSDFADSIVGNEALIQVVGPQKAAELTALAIRLKAVGPIGDEMADIISPPPQEDGEPPTPQQMQQQQAEFQQLQQHAQELEQKLAMEDAKQRATIEKAKIDAASREKIAAANLEAKRMDNETKLAVAELGAKVDRIALFLEERARLGVQAHEADLAAHDRAHEAGLAAMEHQHGLAAGQQAHDQNLEAGEQGADLAMTQAEHAAEIAPEPAGAGA